ncbi:MAG: 7-cyano-7-deazaguanine synthase QueC [Candidatus Omnitrophota bacterium]|nr:7-cyano-7-deazaguanine synthase QueC [Candidatus Omnitrophota bacterium]
MVTAAICLLSGGLDSTVALYAALADGYSVRALTLSYGQVHVREIDSARRIAAELNLEHHILSISLPWKGSALLDTTSPIPVGRDSAEMSREIPSTYVPARNTVFLSFAASFAEARGAEAIFIGANALDYSGYPDCRPEYFDAFSEVLKRGTKAGVRGRSILIETPLLRLSKKEIVELGIKLNIPFEHTWSCYQGRKDPCGECDSCILRAKGFQEAGLTDPLVTRATSPQYS